MADYFYSIEVWPNYAIKLLLTKHFGYHERIGLACFFHGNGLTDSSKALRVFHFYNDSWQCDRNWKIDFRKFEGLFTYLDQANQKPLTDTGIHIGQTYYYYNIALNLTMYYDGTVRTKRGESRKYEYYEIFKKYEKNMK